MVDALHRHARLQHVDTDVLRHRINHAFARGGDLRHRHRLLFHQSSERTAAFPRIQRHLHGTWDCRHALHRHGGASRARRDQLRLSVRCALPGDSDRRVDGGTLAGIPNHGVWTKVRWRRRHGRGHFRYALLGDARDHFCRSWCASRGSRIRKSRSNQSGSGGCRHYVCHSGLRVDSLLEAGEQRASASRRGLAAKRGLPGSSADPEPHGQFRVESRNRRGLLVGGELSDLRVRPGEHAYGGTHRPTSPPGRYQRF